VIVLSHKVIGGISKMYVMDTLIKSINDNGIERKYEYKILRSSFIRNECSGEEIQSYGIEVERKDIQSGKVFNFERNIIKNISPHRYKVQALAKLLCDNAVSPINFVEVLGDYVDEYIGDFDSINKNISII
jgi:hypothetical protein